MMARAGRKRKPAVARSKCGKIIRADRKPADEPLAIAFAQRRKAGAKAGDERNQRNGYELGRLWRDGKLTGSREGAEHAEARHAAGVALATLAARFRAKALAGKPTPPAADFAQVKGRSVTDDDPDEWRKLQWAYTAAQKAISRPCLTAVWRLTILDEGPTPDRDLALIRFGLEGLAQHLGVWPVDRYSKCA